MFKSIIRLAPVSVVAAAVVFLVPVAPKANGTAEPVAVKGDRLVVAKGAACAQRAWPNYEPGCLFDKRRPADEVRKISVINIDRREMQPATRSADVVASR